MSTITNKNASRITLTLDPKNQKLDIMQQLLADIVKRGGCDGCGRLAILDVHFAGDPLPDLKKAGVISFQAQGQ